MAKAELNRRIYGMGTKLGMVEKGTQADDLHYLVYRITGKTSVKELSDDEALAVIGELKEYAKLSYLEENAPPGSVMSEGQKKFAFRLLYRLISLDTEPSKATARERMSGVVGKVTGKSPAPDTDVFKGLSEAEGRAVIEELKRYVSTAAKRQIRREKEKNEHTGLCKG